MKIIWNHPSTSKADEHNSESNIALPKPTGLWMEHSEIETETFFDTDEDNEPSASQIHIPESTKKHLQRLSIQEINLYEQEDTLQETTEHTEIISQPMQNSIEVTNVTEVEITEAAHSPSMNDDDRNENSTIEDTSPNDTIVLPSVLMEIEDTAALELTHTISANNSRFTAHQTELRQMAVFCISIFTMSLIPYTSPALADYRPWKSDEAPPLIGLWTQQQTMTEDASGAIVVVDEDILENEDSDIFFVFFTLNFLSSCF